MVIQEAIEKSSLSQDMFGVGITHILTGKNWVNVKMKMP